jgi:hypothetical protein
MAAYGDDSSRSALTIIPPVIVERDIVSFGNITGENLEGKRTSDTGDGLLSSQIGDMNEGVIE